MTKASFSVVRDKIRVNVGAVIAFVNMGHQSPFLHTLMIHKVSMVNRVMNDKGVINLSGLSPPF